MRGPSHHIAAALAISLALSAPALAQVAIDVTEDASGVTFAISGSLNIDSAIIAAEIPSSGFSGIGPNFGAIVNAGAVSAPTIWYSLEGLTPYGTNSVIEADAVNGGIFQLDAVSAIGGVGGDAVGLAQGYTSSSPISSSLSFTGATIDSLGLTRGTYEYVLAEPAVSEPSAVTSVFTRDNTPTVPITNRTITLTISDMAAVPLPAGLPLLLVGLGGLALLRRKTPG